jgi:hypothetical protein
VATTVDIDHRFAGRMEEGRMNRLAGLCLRLCLAVFPVLLGASAGHAATPLLPLCSWAFEATGTGITNIATPDTNAAYWVMPLDTRNWASMVIRGVYPRARFFNFSTYTATGGAISTITDADISPDAGSTNPFATATATASTQPQTYTVTIGAGAPGSANVLQVAGSQLIFVVYRVYVPDAGLNRTGGVSVPNVSVVGYDGRTRTLRPCPFAAAETSLGNMIIQLAASRFADAANFLQPFLEAANQRGLITGICNPASPGPATVIFGAPTLNPNFFPDPQAVYLETPSFCYQANKIVIVRGKAPVFPNTYAGGTIFEPAFDGQIQVRYWSLCNNNSVVPYPVIACQADFETKRDAAQFYTYVISADQAPPTWLPPDATWLQWGDTSVPKNLIFRNILRQNFEAQGAYMPVGVFCDEMLFVEQGWQGCFAAAGITVALQ